MAFWTTTKRVARYGFIGFIRNGFVSFSAILVMTITLFVIAALLIGNAALHKVGPKAWNKRVRKAIGFIATLTSYDTLAIGGGNAKRLDFSLPVRVRVVSNEAGITGGIRLWDPLLDPLFVAEDTLALREA